MGWHLQEAAGNQGLFHGLDEHIKRVAILRQRSGHKSEIERKDHAFRERFAE